jgi:AbrB family looped-hinge helix DNA binding protein
MASNAIDKWVNPRRHTTVTTKITIDKSGRVVIPKPLRQQMHLAPGDELQLECEGERITLRPVRPQATLKKEYGVWVYQGEATDAYIPDLIDRERKKRLR